jgi:hypothetical protein
MGIGVVAGFFANAGLGEWSRLKRPEIVSWTHDLQALQYVRAIGKTCKPLKLFHREFSVSGSCSTSQALPGASRHRHGVAMRGIVWSTASL